MALRADQTRLQALVANVAGAIYRCSHDADYTMEVISDNIERISDRGLGAALQSLAARTAARRATRKLPVRSSARPVETTS